MILNCPRCNTRFAVDEKAIGEGRDVKCGACAHVWFVNPNPLGDDFADFMPMTPKEEAASSAEGDDLVATLEEAYEGKKRPEQEETAEQEENTLEDGLESEANEDTEDDGEMIPEFEEMDDAENVIPNFAMPAVSEEAGPVPPSYKYTLGGLVAAILLMAIMTYHINVPLLGGMLGVQNTEGLKLADVQVREIPSREKARYIVEGKIVNTSDEERSIPILHVALLDEEGTVMVSREFEAEKTLKPGEDTPFTASRLDTAFRDRLTHILVELGSGVQLTIRN